MNGLLALCAMAFGNEGRTSIKEEKEKNLRRDQGKFVKE